MPQVYKHFSEIPDTVTVPADFGPAWPQRVSDGGPVAGMVPKIADSVFVAGVTAEMETLITRTTIIHRASLPIGQFLLTYVDDLIESLTDLLISPRRALMQDGQDLTGWITRAVSFSLTGPSAGGLFQYFFDPASIPRYLRSWTDSVGVNQVADVISSSSGYDWHPPQFGNYDGLADQMLAVKYATATGFAVPGSIECAAVSSKNEEFVYVLETGIPEASQMWKRIFRSQYDPSSTGLYDEEALLTEAGQENWVDSEEQSPDIGFGIDASLSAHTNSYSDVVDPDGSSTRELSGRIYVRWPDLTLSYDQVRSRFPYIPESLKPTVSVFLAIEGRDTSFTLDLPFQYWKETAKDGTVTSSDPTSATIDLGPPLQDMSTYAADLISRGGQRPPDWEAVPGASRWGDISPLRLTGDRVFGPSSGSVATYASYDGVTPIGGNYGGVFVAKICDLNDTGVFEPPDGPDLSDIIGRLANPEFLSRSIITDLRPTPIREGKRADLSVQFRVGFTVKLVYLAKVPRGFRCAPYSNWVV